MAFRGRGRGRGFGGRGGFIPAKQEAFELFPLKVPLVDKEIELPDPNNVPVEMALIARGLKLERFWNSSPYYYETQDGDIKRREGAEVGQFSNRDVKRTAAKVPLSHFIKMTDDYVPAELASKGEKQRRAQKKVRWNPESDLHKLDFFEKLEQRNQGQDEKGGKEKDDEDEEVDDENAEEEEEDFSDDDYNQNVDFDDDEDDFNMADDNDDEPIY